MTKGSWGFEYSWVCGYNNCSVASPKLKKINLLGVEKTPPSLNTSKLCIFPGFVEVLKQHDCWVNRKCKLTTENVPQKRSILCRWHSLGRQKYLGRSEGKPPMLGKHRCWRCPRRMIAKNHTSVIVQEIISIMLLTVGQPVSAMNICGVLLSAWAGATLVVWKNSAVQPAAFAMDWLANQGCTFDICKKFELWNIISCTDMTYAVRDIPQNKSIEVRSSIRCPDR